MLATTGLWPVKSRLKDVIAYADNPDKTTNPKYVDDDLYSAIQYAENDKKTDKKLFVEAINCPTARAYECMMATKRRFGKLGGNVAYHGFQSFRSGEVTPEEAFEIGKETARRMWGDKYEVVVTVHLNCDQIHCHFVANSVSFKDGSKFENHHYDHLRLREISDEVCVEYGKSVLKDSTFWGHHKGEYWQHKNGQMTHRDMIKEDVEYALRFSESTDDVYRYLKSIGYTINDDRKHLTIMAVGWQRPVRMDTLGFTREYLNKRLNENYHDPDISYFKRRYPPYKPKAFPLLYEIEELEVTIEHSHDIGKIYVALLFLVIIRTFELLHEMREVFLLSVDLRHEVKDLKQYISDYHFMRNNDIETLEDLFNDIQRTKTEISELEQQRYQYDNKRRRTKTPGDINIYKEKRKELTKQITPLRKRLKQAEKIWDKSPHLLELVKQERSLEMQARQRNRNKDWSR